MKRFHKNQRGSLTLLFLLSCPLLLSASCFAIASFLMVNTYQMVNHSCQETALKVQKVMAQSIKEIISLNPSAKKLHHDHQRYRRLSLLSGPSQAISAALLTKTILQQIALKKRQKLQIYKARTRAQKILRQSQRDLNLSFSTSSSHFAQAILFEDLNTQWSFPALAVMPQWETIHWVAPQYRVRPRFETKQALKAEWSFQVQTIPGIQWIASWISLENRLRGACGSTLRKRGHEWIPILKKVNS